MERNLMEVSLTITVQGQIVELTLQDRKVRKDEGCLWIFMKVTMKLATKKMIDDYLDNAWNIHSWVRIQQLSASAFKLGLRDIVDYERILKAKWD